MTLLIIRLFNQIIGSLAASTPAIYGLIYRVFMVAIIFPSKADLVCSDDLVAGSKVSPVQPAVIPHLRCIETRGARSGPIVVAPIRRMAGLCAVTI